MEEFKNLKDEIKNNHKQSKQALIEMNLKQTAIEKQAVIKENP